MNSLAYGLMQAQALIALAVVLYGVYCFVLDRQDMSTLFVLRYGTFLYMMIFTSACLIGLLP